MLDKTSTAARPASFAITCSDVQQFVEVMFGPQQHDHHMRLYRVNKDRAIARRANEIANAQIAAAGSVTAWLRSK
jgi:hypothetical protein